MEYGINYRSPLHKIVGFHVALGQIPQDLMHVLFEGVLLLELRLMLNAFVYVDHFVTLNRLNSRIKNFKYGRNEKRNKPSKPIEKNHITGVSKLPLSGKHIHMYMHNYVRVPLVGVIIL